MEYNKLSMSDDSSSIVDLQWYRKSKLSVGLFITSLAVWINLVEKGLHSFRTWLSIFSLFIILVLGLLTFNENLNVVFVNKIRDYYSSLVYLIIFIMSHSHLFAFMTGYDNINIINNNHMEGSKNFPRAFMMDNNNNPSDLNSDRVTPVSKRRKMDISSDNKSISDSSSIKSEDDASIVTHDSRNSHIFFGIWSRITKIVMFEGELALKWHQGKIFKGAAKENIEKVLDVPTLPQLQVNTRKVNRVVNNAISGYLDQHGTSFSEEDKDAFLEKCEKYYMEQLKDPKKREALREKIEEHLRTTQYIPGSNNLTKYEKTKYQVLRDFFKGEFNKYRTESERDIDTGVNFIYNELMEKTNETLIEADMEETKKMGKIPVFKSSMRDYGKYSFRSFFKTFFKPEHLEDMRNLNLKGKNVPEESESFFNNDSKDKGKGVAKEPEFLYPSEFKDKGKGVARDSESIDHSESQVSDSNSKGTRGVRGHPDFPSFWSSKEGSSSSSWNQPGTSDWSKPGPSGSNKAGPSSSNQGGLSYTKRG
jgi:hypothetical protein